MRAWPLRRSHPTASSTSITCRGHWWVAAGAGLLLGSVAFAPARWAAQWIDQATQGQVQLRNPHGSLWQGQADLLLRGGHGSQTELALPQGVQWQLRPGWAEGTPILRLHLLAPCCMAQPMPWQLYAGWSGAGVRMAAHRSQWPAGWLAGLGTPWNTIGLQGQLVLDSPALGLHWAQGRLRWSGGFTLDALDLTSPLSTLQPLGSYRVSFEGHQQQATPRLHLHTLHGDLTLQGEGQWSGSRLRFRGTAQATPASVGAVSNLLNLLGRRDGLRAHISIG